MRKTNVHDTNNHLYTCEYCFTEFVPKRRRVQKYCSNSCRSKAYHWRQQSNCKEGLTGSESETKEDNRTRIDKMSLAGVGNAAAGAAAVNLIAKLLTSEDNKPATKGDLKQIAQNLKRYHRIENMVADQYGRLPYFDLYHRKLLYAFDKNV